MAVDPLANALQTCEQNLQTWKKPPALPNADGNVPPNFKF